MTSMMKRMPKIINKEVGSTLALKHAQKSIKMIKIPINHENLMEISVKKTFLM